VLDGLDVHPLLAGHTVLEAFLLIKCLNERGDSTWAYRTTNRLNREELLGALIVHCDLIRAELLSGWDESDEDADDD
jgi:hypothetical protein